MPRKRKTHSIVISETESNTSDESPLEDEESLRESTKETSDEEEDKGEIGKEDKKSNEEESGSEEEERRPKKNKIKKSELLEEHKILETITNIADTKFQAKEFFITFNDFDDVKLNNFKEFVNTDDVITCYMAKEEAPSTHHVHYHCYILFRKRKWRKNLNSKFHGDYRRIISTPAHCFNYISKDNNIVINKNIEWLKKLGEELYFMEHNNKNAVIGGYWKKGTYKLFIKKKSGEKTKRFNEERTIQREENAAAFIDFVEKNSMEAIKEKFPIEYKNRLPTIIRIKSEYEKTLQFKPYQYSLKQKNYWLWGEAGTSKTTYATEGISKFFTDFNQDKIYMKAFNTKWFDGYNPMKHICICIDDITKLITQEQTGLLKLILDRNMFHAEVKGSSINLIPNNFIVIITSNYRIEDIFPNIEDQKAISRRCQIFHCVSLTDYRNGIYKDGVLSTMIPPPPHICRILGKEDLLEGPLYNNLQDECWHDNDNIKFLFKNINGITLSRDLEKRYPEGIILQSKDPRTLNQLYIPNEDRFLYIISNEELVDPLLIEKEDAQVLLNEYLKDEEMILTQKQIETLDKYFKDRFREMYIHRENMNALKRFRERNKEETYKNEQTNKEENTQKNETKNESKENKEEETESEDEEESKSDEDSIVEDPLEELPLLKYFFSGNQIDINQIKKNNNQYDQKSNKNTKSHN